MDITVKYTHSDYDLQPITRNAIVILDPAPQMHPEQPAGLVLLGVVTDGLQDSSALSPAEREAGHPMVRRLAAKSPTADKRLCCLDATASEPMQSTLDWLQSYVTTIVGVTS